ncbi:MAG: hypothetical protein WCI43_09695 [Candidatus Firestonebacteria bacterium]
MEKTFYCETHKEHISLLTCKACGRRLCNSCAKFAFGKTLCASCFTLERLKSDRSYSDPLGYSAIKVQKRDYSRLALKYFTGFFLWLALAGIIFFRKEVYTLLEQVFVK